MIIKEEIVEKSKVEREYMSRLDAQNAAEEEGLKYVRTIKGADLTEYKNRKYKNKKYKSKRLVSAAEQRFLDRRRLKRMRYYQLLSGFIGLSGTSVIILSIDDSRSLWPILENSLRQMNLLWPGFALTVWGIITKIWFQHRHDKISDRMRAGYSDRISDE